jgi:hypothetical protein
LQAIVVKSFGAQASSFFESLILFAASGFPAWALLGSSCIPCAESDVEIRGFFHGIST